jgi:hypothetical protein
MAKIPQAVIDAVPGLKAAQANEGVTFINMDTDDTSPTVTAGFTDEQIREMSEDRLQAMLAQINAEEQRIQELLTDVYRRRNETHALLRRKAEL